jgi:hypothetical protein
MIQFPPEKKILAELVMIYQVKIEKMGVHAYIIPSFPNGGRKLFRLEGRLLYVWLRRNWMSP